MARNAENPVWPSGAKAVRAKHCGYGWGDLYKNQDGTHCLLKHNGRKYLVRSLEEITNWDNNPGAVKPLKEGTHESSEQEAK